MLNCKVEEKGFGIDIKLGTFNIFLKEFCRIFLNRLLHLEDKKSAEQRVNCKIHPMSGLGILMSFS